MDATQKIEESFKELLKTTPYSKITVLQICEHADLSRKTFYAHFDGKEAIVESLFQEHAIEPVHSLNKMLAYYSAIDIEHTLNEHLYQSVFAEKEYYYNLVRSMGNHDDTFLRVVTKSIYGLNREIMGALTRKQESAAWEEDYIAYFYASSQAMLLQKWITEKMVVPPHDLAVLYYRMTSFFWQQEYSL